jgi:hypothetical protein
MRTAALLLLGALLPSCEGWEFGERAPALNGGAPFSLSVEKTEACAAEPGADPRRGPLLGVLVRVTGRHEAGTPANYFYGSLLTRSGERYLAELAGCAPVLSGPPLGPGESRTGYLNFPIPAGALPDRVAYAPSFDGTRGAEKLKPAALTVEARLP